MGAACGCVIKKSSSTRNTQIVTNKQGVQIGSSNGESVDRNSKNSNNRTTLVRKLQLMRNEYLSLYAILQSREEVAQ